MYIYRKEPRKIKILLVIFLNFNTQFFTRGLYFKKNKTSFIVNKKKKVSKFLGARFHSTFFNISIYLYIYINIGYG